jgi:60 kDa SS-A/Ro ribonucleoprotein
MKYNDLNIPPTQRERADARQVQNSAGGFVYQVDDETRLRRFLVLGTEGGTFYASQKDLTKANIEFLKAFAVRDPNLYFGVLADVDAANKAPRHSTVLVALAVLYAYGAPVTTTTSAGEQSTFDVRTEIEARFTEFVRTATHLFEFVGYITQFRAWGRSLRRLVGSWYLALDPTRLAYQVVKYRERAGWTHRDLLRKAHPKAEGRTDDILNYATSGLSERVAEVDVIQQFEAVKAGALKPEDSTALTWEMLPTEALRDRYVWRALIERNNLPYTAMLRNLARMTNLDVFVDLFALGKVVETLGDPEAIKRARVHPFTILNALKTYSAGYGFRGDMRWVPNQKIVDTLDQAFYLSFGNVPSTGKRVNIALDVSGSMGARLMDSNITAREGSVAMAMATLAADPNTTEVTAFSSNPGAWTMSGHLGRFSNYPAGLSPVGLSARRRLDDNVRTVQGIRMGGTDCSLPMLWAMENKREFDAFVIYTDNETWAGSVQPMQALRLYRKASGIDARLIVVGMTSTGFTIADPEDAGSLDVVGFDASAPGIISSFISGAF